MIEQLTVKAFTPEIAQELSRSEIGYNYFQIDIVGISSQWTRTDIIIIIRWQYPSESAGF